MASAYQRQVQPGAAKGTLPAAHKQASDRPISSTAAPTHAFAAMQLAAPARSGSAIAGRGSALPAALRRGVEQLSGLPMHGVQVHYNSPRPALLGAHAFAREGQIHLGPGHERYMAHEAWHLVQQRQGRVAALTQAGDVAINDHPALEQEADMMGERAMRLGASLTATLQAGRGAHPASAPTGQQTAAPAVAQCGGGARSKMRKRFRKIREGKRAPRKAKPADALHQADFGEKAVTVYRVEHDAKPAIVNIGPRNREQPQPNVSMSEMKAGSTHYFSFGTPARALANHRLRVNNQLTAHNPDEPKHNGSRVLPSDMAPRFKSFKVSNEFARKIQRTAVTQDRKAAFPSNPENSDQNWAPDQYGLTDEHVIDMANHILPNSGKQYNRDDMLALAAQHGSGHSSDDHMRDRRFPDGELRKKLEVRRVRGSGKLNRKMFARPDTYDRATDPHESDEDDASIDADARRYLIRR